MDKTTLKVTMAGFFHDIGKLADREALKLTDGDIDNNSQYLQCRDGRTSHYHAVYTAAFIEQYKNDLPSECNASQWGEGDIFVNLSAGHHNPESPMQHIITAADWLTAGIDRDVFGKDAVGIAPQKYKATRLLPLFEQLLKPPMDSDEAFKWAYPLRPLSPDSIFPQLREGAITAGAQKEYISLFDTFVRELRDLKHGESNVELWFEHFESLMMRCCSQMPAARAGKVVPDVSLYDHCRLTAAFAASLYLYHKETTSLDTKSIKDNSRQKFLLLCGNFYGIQDFIFAEHGESQKYRSKMLRGRSFYISLLTDLAADMLCREIGLTSINVIMNAAGRFTILAPNILQVLNAIGKVESIVNEWLISIAFGEVSMGFTYHEASQSDFLPDQFVRLWESLGRRIEEKKYVKIDLSKYGGRIADYLDRFDNRLENPLCPLCGKRPAVQSTERFLLSPDLKPVCLVCRDQIHIGTSLVKEKHIVITDVLADVPGELKSLSKPIFGKYQLSFETEAAEKASPSRILKYWDISLSMGDEIECNVTRRFINGYVPRYSDEDVHDPRCAVDKDAKEGFPEVGAPKTFNHISSWARHRMDDDKLKGLEALGVLKADVDHLGVIMSCGLEKQKRRFTISRIATLSRQLNYFFALYLPHLLSQEPRFNNVYTVFAGGDDLLLIGPWNRIYELSMELNEIFKKYVCMNEEVHFSAGIALHKAHTPLKRLAENAERALGASKNKDAGHRNRLTIFNETISWVDLSALEIIRAELEVFLESGWVTVGMLYRLNGFIELAERERMILERGEASIAEMACLKWRSMLSYSTERNVGYAIKDKEKRRQVISTVTLKLVEWLNKFKGNIRIPLWNLLYNRR
ncbi:MAG: type III-A CRISPR-associated protein Cas10/Csm1 [Pseudomonadota bacterium]